MTQLLALIRLQIATWWGDLRGPGAFVSEALLWTVSLLFGALALILAGILAHWLEGFVGAARRGSSPLPPELVAALVLASLQLTWMLRALLPNRRGRKFGASFLLALPLSRPRLFLYEVLSTLFDGFVLLLLPTLVIAHFTMASIAGYPLIGLTLFILDLGFWLVLFTWIEVTVHGEGERLSSWGRKLKRLVLPIALGAILALSAGMPTLRVWWPEASRWAEAAVYWTPAWQGALALGGLLRGDLGPFRTAILADLGWIAVVGTAAYVRWTRSLLQQTGSALPSALSAGSAPIPPPRSPVFLVMERELRHLLRNPQVRLLLVFPFILLLGKGLFAGWHPALPGLETSGGIVEAGTAEGSGTHGALLAVLGWLLLVYGSLFNNQFGLDGHGAARFLLVPLPALTLLRGKNRTLALLFSIQWTLLLIADVLLYHDIDPATFWTALCAAFVAIPGMNGLGNFISLYFPRRSIYGERLDAGRWGILLMVIEVPLVLCPSILVMGGTAETSGAWIRIALMSALVPPAWALYAWVLLPGASRLWARRASEVVQAVGGGPA